jgi:hypothetical protein
MLLVEFAATIAGIEGVHLAMVADLLSEWVNRTDRGWGLAHRFRLRIDIEDSLLGSVRTLCGREVLAKDIIRAGYENRCKTCTKCSGEENLR